jgi:hypothetical protein
MCVPYLGTTLLSHEIQYFFDAAFVQTCIPHDKVWGIPLFPNICGRPTVAGIFEIGRTVRFSDVSNFGAIDHMTIFLAFPVFIFKRKMWAF